MKFYLRSAAGEVSGPFDAIEIAGLADAKKITADTLAAPEGAEKWQRLGELLPGLFQAAAAAVLPSALKALRARSAYKGLREMITAFKVLGFVVAGIGLAACLSRGTAPVDFVVTVTWLFILFVVPFSAGFAHVTLDLADAALDRMKRESS